MSAVPAAASAATHILRMQADRPVRRLRPVVTDATPRKVPAGTTADTAHTPDLAPALLTVAGLAAFALLCLPALRAELAIGWLPLWLLAAPLAGWAALRLTRRGGRERMGSDGDNGRAGRRYRHRDLRQGAQALRQAPSSRGPQAVRRAA